MRVSKLALRIACSGVALAWSAVGGAAGAQETVGPTSDDEVAAEDDQSSDRSGDEPIVVTGTNISGVKPVGNVATILTADDAVKAGYSSPAELLRTVPQVRPGEFDADGGRSTISLQNAGGANTVSLRGLGGSSATLMLIDGRRFVQVGTNTSGSDANQLPLAALERIEIIADGASAVYGSDAVAGVINYIVRKNYDGAELTLRGNTNSGNLEVGGDATLGKTWEGLGSLGGGNFLVSYGYTHRDPTIAGKNPWLRKDGRSVGGVDLRLNQNAAQVGLVPNIIVDGGAGNFNTTIPAAGTWVYYGLPAGANVGLTPANLRLNDPNLIDYADFTDYTGALSRHQVAVFANQELGAGLELFFQGSYLNRKTRTESAEGVTQTFSVVLPRFLTAANGTTPTTTPNPFYIAGIPGVGPTANLTVQYPILRDFGRRVYEGSDESYNLTAGLRADLPGGWRGEAFYTYGRNEGCGYCLTNGYINTAALQYQINIGAINPLSGVPLSPAQVATFTGRQTQIGHNGLDDAVIKFNGPLFDLPAGSIRAAFGGEYLKQFNYNENTSVTGISNVTTVLTNKANSYYDRSIKSAFGEVYVPLVSDDMGVPLMQSLTASAAVRYDDYSDSGETTNPKFGLTWEVADFLAFSGTWGTSFVAPSITDKNPSAYVSGLITPLTQPYLSGATSAERLARTDPRFNSSPLPFLPELLCGSIVPGACIITNTAILFGSNPNLRPQTSTNWTLSAEFNPGAGFRASVNYYNIDYKDRIVFPQTLGEFLAGPTPGSNPPSYRGYEQFIIPISRPAGCVPTDLSTADPVLQQLLSRPIYGSSSGVGALASFPDFCAIRGVIDSRFTNLGRTRTDGLDVDIGWTGEAGEVRLNATAAANVVLNNKETAGPGAPEISRINTQNTPVRWRGRGSIGAAWRGFNTTLFANYVGAISNTEHRSSVLSAPVTLRIPAYTTFDLNLGYNTDFEGRSSGMLKGLRGSVTILNLFDRDPQTVVNGFGSVIAGRTPLWGRTVSFQLTGSF